ncbi:MAG TPA: homocysteine S-methyltransferase family protein [candidate division Zixibacteria bacterium]|nr:homocysteine S-methyltransferase family protein [candidate division Zixibacteria bacterium]
MAKPYDILHERLRRRELLVLDGGVGSEIVRRGVRWRQHGLRTDADTVRAVHTDYIEAGADIVTTDTFQLTRRTYLNLFRNLDHMRRIGAPGLESQAAALTAKAVLLAREAREKAGGNRTVAIAGSIAPLNHCFRPDLAPPSDEALREHAETVRLLADAGVDFILLETMNNAGEAAAALRAAKATGLPVWASFTLAPGGRTLLSGEPIADAVRAAESAPCDAVLLNCAPPPDISAGLEELSKRCKLPFGAYAHIGRYDPPSWKFDFHPQFCDTEEWPPEKYAAHARRWRESGAAILGGCCGTTPAHIKAVKELLQ